MPTAASISGGVALGFRIGPRSRDVLLPPSRQPNTQWEISITLIRILCAAIAQSDAIASRFDRRTRVALAIHQDILSIVVMHDSAQVRSPPNLILMRICTNVRCAYAVREHELS